MPLFLQTCRMWYTFCPKYKQYHYASQFIYSKSQKGKVNPGRALPSGSLPERDIPIPFVGGLLSRALHAARNRQSRAVNEVKTLRDFVEADNGLQLKRQGLQTDVGRSPLWGWDPHVRKLSLHQRPRFDFQC
ncbi:unnamed protein product [Gongylonema pulchrum]|uniref:Carn_acyltransf domain-containing protein n=1 Tax=Gongylonema pulchrum TaxID=637853 RepID=A0A183DEE3_9BILA|nr:unnamed protein product [Gongylonema pulchrum]